MNKGSRQEILLHIWRVPHYHNQYGISFHFIITVFLTLKLCHTAEICEAQPERPYYVYPSSVTLSLSFSYINRLQHMLYKSLCSRMSTQSVNSCKVSTAVLFMSETNCSILTVFSCTSFLHAVCNPWLSFPSSFTHHVVNSIKKDNYSVIYI